MILTSLFDDILLEIKNNLSNGSFGTGTTSETVADTSLENEIAATIGLVDGISIDGLAVNAVRTLGVDEANGNTITEAGFSDGVKLKVRATFPGVNKDSTTSLDFAYGVVLEQENL